MKVAAALLVMAFLATSPAQSRGSHHGLFFGGHHAHSINAWMGSHRPKLR